MRSKKRFLSFILTFSVLFALFVPFRAYASNAVYEECNTYCQSGYGLYYVILEDGNLWELDSDGEGSIVLENAVSVQAASYGCIALKSDGTVWMIHIKGNECEKVFDNTKKIYATGSFYSMRGKIDTFFAIKNDESLWGWGENTFSLLGNSNSVGKYVSNPMKLMDNVSSVTVMSECAADCVLAIKTDSSLWAWGTKCDLLAGFNRPTEKAADYSYTLSAMGTVLDEGTFHPEYIAPFKVCDGVKSCYMISYYPKPCAFMIMNNGELWGFGDNSNFQLGIDNSASWIGPTKILTGVRSVSVSSHATYNNRTTFAVRNDNTLWIWGVYDVDSSSPRYLKTPNFFANNIKYVSYYSSWNMIRAMETNGNYVIYNEYEELPANITYDGNFQRIRINATGLEMKYIIESSNAVFAGGHVLENDRTLGLYKRNFPNGLRIKTVDSMDADEPSNWAKAEVYAAVDSGLVPENLQHNYTKPVTRADVAQMFVNLIEKSSGMTMDAFLAKKGVEINPAAFTDTTDKAVLTCNALDIINGVGNNAFAPNGTFTRGQIAAILNRIAGTLGIDTNGCTHSFTDVAGHWCSAELGWPVQAGIINGVGNNKFDPEGAPTTEQAIAIAYRAMNVISDYQ